MPYFTDQAGRSVHIKNSPKKIISLVPSQTELLADLGLDKSVTGITKFCIHPAGWFRTKQRVGGTKNPDIELIRHLQPDLIIGNKEENRKEDIEQLENDLPVWLSDVNTLQDALQMIDELSRITDTTERGQEIIVDIRNEFGKLNLSVQSDPGKSKQLPGLPEAKVPADTSLQPNLVSSPTRKFRICYLIWQEPYIAVGSNTFIHSMIEACGFINVFKHESRYPTISQEAIRSAGCDFIFFSTEPYPFTEKHLESSRDLFAGAKPILVDGEMFSWYGSRLVRSAPYFQRLINKLHDAAAT